MSNHKVKLYILHHPESIYLDRKEKLLKDLERHDTKYPTVWIENFNPSTEDRHNFPEHSIETRQCSLTLKHKYVLELSIKEQIDYSIVMEDDINLNCVPDFNDFLDKCLNEFIETKGDMCFFGGVYPFFVSDPVPNQYLYYGHTTRCTHGYIISNNCATKIVDQFHFKKNVDHMYNDIIENNNLKCAWTHPHLTQ